MTSFVFDISLNGRLLNSFVEGNNLISFLKEGPFPGLEVESITSANPSELNGIKHLKLNITREGYDQWTIDQDLALQTIEFSDNGLDNTDASLDTALSMI